MGGARSTSVEMTRMQFREGTLRCECAAEGVTCVCLERFGYQGSGSGVASGMSDGEVGMGVGGTRTDVGVEMEMETKKAKVTWIEEWGQVLYCWHFVGLRFRCHIDQWLLLVRSAGLVRVGDAPYLRGVLIEV